jgi:hypothetical protein
MAARYGHQVLLQARSPPRSPSRSPSRPPTTPRPFKLESVQRHEEYMAHGFAEKLARQAEQKRQEELAALRQAVR